MVIIAVHFKGVFPFFSAGAVYSFRCNGMVHARVRVCKEISSRCCEAHFWCGRIVLDGEVTCQNGVRDLDRDLQNEVKVRKSQNFNYPYLEEFLTQNHNVWCSDIGS